MSRAVLTGGLPLHVMQQWMKQSGRIKECAGSTGQLQLGEEYSRTCIGLRIHKVGAVASRAMLSNGQSVYCSC